MTKQEFPSEVERNSLLVPAYRPSTYGRRATARVATLAIQRELISNRHLDFWSLALCSCFLTLLCHSLANPPQAVTAKHQTIAQDSPNVATRSSSHLTLKLFTLPATKPEIESEADGQEQ
jgi:hypothetical protein